MALGEQAEAEGVSQEGSPFVAVRLPHPEPLNERLRDALLAMSAAVPDRATNVPGGLPLFENKWLSHAALHLHDPPAFRELGTIVEEIANKRTQRTQSGRLLCVTAMWGLISRSGMAGDRHNHRGSVSSVYYVDAGASGERHGGLLQLYADGDKAAPSHVIVPQSGLLVLFPSSLQHAVSRYSGDDPRIVISANLR